MILSPRERPGLTSFRGLEQFHLRGDANGVGYCIAGAKPYALEFSNAADVICLRDVPSEFSAVLSGHIHRHQVLITDLERRPVRVPVLYPGSIERTSFAEMEEQKGYLLLRLDATTPRSDIQWEFRPLPARPMIRRNWRSA